MRISVCLFVFAFVFALNANAMHGARSHYKWWQDPKIASEINLTDEQSEAIEKIFSSYKKQFVQYKKQLNESELELKKELRNPKAKKEDVLQLIDNIEDIKAAYTRTKVEMFLKVRDVLTPEQETKLHQIKLRFQPYHR